MILLTAALSLLIAWLVIRPCFFRADALLDELRTNQPLVDQRDRCLQILKDLELDFSTRKIDESEFGRTRDRINIELEKIDKALAK